MIENNVKKASARFSFLYRKKNCLNETVRKLLGNALVQCHIDYCISSWYNDLSKTLKQKLHVIQSRLVSFILDLHPRQHIDQTMLDSPDWIFKD